MSDHPGDLVDAEAITTAYDISEATIRSWAHRGYLTKYPQGHRQRTLYSLSEFAKVFTEKRGICPPSVDGCATLDASGRGVPTPP